MIGYYFWSKERNVGRGRLNSSIQQWMLCITYMCDKKREGGVLAEIVDA